MNTVNTVVTTNLSAYTACKPAWDEWYSWHARSKQNSILSSEPTECKHTIKNIFSTRRYSKETIAYRSPCSVCTKCGANIKSEIAEYMLKVLDSSWVLSGTKLPVEINYKNAENKEIDRYRLAAAIALRGGAKCLAPC